MYLVVPLKLQTALTIPDVLGPSDKFRLFAVPPVVLLDFHVEVHLEVLTSSYLT